MPKQEHAGEKVYIMYLHKWFTIRKKNILVKLYIKLAAYPVPMLGLMQDIRLAENSATMDIMPDIG